jgi:DNA-binding CsgD family transcriptional regulator
MEAERAGGLLERERELAEIDALLAQTADGRGGVVIVDGPPGIGKTRLLEAARECSQLHSVGLRSARGGVMESEYPYGLARRLVGPLVRQRVELGEPLTTVAGAAAPLFGSAEGRLSTDHGELAVALSAALCDIVLTAAATEPLLVTVDDVHWGDVESVRFLSALATRAPDAPVLLMAAIRLPQPRANNATLAGLVAHGGACHLTPAPLSNAAVERLLADQLGMDPTPDFVSACALATNGNPFLCTELARTLSGGGMTAIDAHVERLSGLVPTAVARAVLARIALLPDESRRASAGLAVLGGRASWSLLAALTELEHDALSQSLDDLAAAAVVTRTSMPEFLHPMIRAAVYEDLPVSQRDRDHHRAAELLTCTGTADENEIAAHLLIARPRGERWVAELLGRSATRALRHGAADTAVAYLSRALEEAPDGDLVVELLGHLGDAESRRGNPHLAANALRAAMEQTRDPLRRGALAIPLGLALTRSGHADEATEILGLSVAALPHHALELGCSIETELEVIAHLSGQAGRQVRGRSRRFLAPAGTGEPSDSGQRLALAGRADEEMNRGRADQAAALALLALQDGELMRATGSGVVLFFSTAIVLLYCDHLDAAEQVYREAARHGSEHGHRSAVASAQGFLAGVHHRRGELRHAERAGRQALETANGTSDVLRTTFAGAFLLDALVELGELGRATRLLSELGAQEQLHDALITNILQHARGRLRSAAGEHRRALADHLECGRRAAEWDMQTPAVANWRSLAAEAYAILGDHEAALDHAAAGTESARAFGSPRAIGMALRVEGAIAKDTQRLQEAVAVLEQTPARLDHAHALVTLGCAQRRAGQRVLARATLGKGLRLARICGATPLARTADGELRILGSRTRRVTRSGRDVLTASEERVAALAASGYSNQQIAEALTVSIRTVETHLAHSYQKLAIIRRGQLAAILKSDIG